MIEIGKPITEEQKNLFHRLLTTNDLIEITADKEVNVSYSTVKELYYRTCTITDRNKEAVVKMINLSFKKTQDAIVYFAKAKQELEQMLPKAV
jgi:hypothetical protein